MVQKAYKYANGGKVARKNFKQRPAEKVSVVDAMRGTVRRKQEQALGLRDGGPVKMPPKETRKIPPTQLPAPQSGSKPKRIGKR